MLNHISDTRWYIHLEILIWSLHQCLLTKSYAEWSIWVKTDIINNEILLKSSNLQFIRGHNWNKSRKKNSCHFLQSKHHIGFQLWPYHFDFRYLKLLKLTSIYLISHILSKFIIIISFFCCASSFWFISILHNI